MAMVLNQQGKGGDECFFTHGVDLNCFVDGSQLFKRWSEVGFDVQVVSDLLMVVIAGGSFVEQTKKDLSAGRSGSIWMRELIFSQNVQQFN